ncbi:unnamed protein product [Amoebophrya sp. A25]|nr:unnamed protein product [Amoebophrya sp. A25]|eukprot:GSA25T00011345001.1
MESDQDPTKIQRINHRSDQDRQADKVTHGRHSRRVGHGWRGCLGFSGRCAGASGFSSLSFVVSISQLSRGQRTAGKVSRKPIDLDAYGSKINDQQAKGLQHFQAAETARAHSCSQRPAHVVLSVLTS